MELNYFEQQLKGLLPTCATGRSDLKVKWENEHKILSIFKEHKLIIKIHFATAEKDISIFQAEMLKNIFIDKRKPLDYANYHKCEAGKKFIQNIESLYINEPVVTIQDNLKAI